MTQTITETIGVDLGDKYSNYCVLDQETGDPTKEGRIRTTPAAFERFFAGRETARVVLEVGTHSPWTSRIASADCGETYIANARKLRFIFKNERKSDRVDAQSLARVGRFDPELLSPIRHRGEQAQVDLALIRARATLVSARTKLVNSLRGLIKATGSRLPKTDARYIGPKTIDGIPTPLHGALAPMLEAIDGLSDQISVYDKRVDKLAKETYPEAEVLTQVPGVGNLTALAFMLTLEDPAHYKQSRDVGAFIGLVPGRDQSGEMDKQLRITKAGDKMLRTLLVQCAQHILGRCGPPCDLKRAGERIAMRGGKIAKRKAVIAVARKLAVLLHSLWRTSEVYAPDRTSSHQ
jgi:transposase